MENQTEKKWYQNPTAVVLFLIFFFPVGLILMWKHDVWSQTARWIVTAMFTILIIIRIGGGSDNKSIYSGTWSTLTGDSKSRLHNQYPHYIGIEFANGNIEAYESSDGLKSCVCVGSYNKYDNGDIEITGISNSNCPWMSKVNGIYYRSDNHKRYYILENSYLKFAKKK